MSRPKIGAARNSAGALARPDEGVMAQGRNYDRVRLEDLPEPVDVGDKAGALDTAETELLGLCERAVDAWLDDAVLFAKALANLRDRRLYRATHATFEAYVADRFGRGRQWAYREIERYEVAQALALSPRGDKDEPRELLPSKHARELASTIKKHGAEVGREQYERAAADGPVTGQTLRKARKDIEAERAPQPDREVLEGTIVEDSPSIDDHLKEARLMVAELHSAKNRWQTSMQGLGKAGVDGITLRQEIGRLSRWFNTANEHDNA